MTVGLGWRPMVAANLGQDAVMRAVDVAERLRGCATADPGLEGFAGLAILFGQLDRIRPGAGWDLQAHRSLTAAVRGLETAGHGAAGLYVGLGAVAAAAEMLSRDGTRYGGLLGALDATIRATAAEQSAQLTASPVNRPFEVFDLVFGVAGMSTYLLGRGRPELDGLVALCGTGPDGPNWFTPAEAIEGTSLGQSYSGGIYNCGLAHGIPGPLAVLSLALQQGHVVAGQIAAIEQVAEWLTAQRVDDEWGPNWPSCVAPGDPLPEPAHSAWCYGSPGVARALWHAGVATDNETLRDLAVESMMAVIRRPWSARQIEDSPGLCHGVAGLLQITLRFASDTGRPEFAAAAEELTETLLGLYRPDLSTGYYSRTGKRTEVFEHPGLLDGAAGAALALLAAATDAEPRWDRVLLLS